MRLVEYVTEDGQSPFARWFKSLEPSVAVRISVQLFRIEQGNLGSLKSVGGGVLESRLDFGPGYRIYMGRDGDQLVILLTGGTKKRQDKDIEEAHRLWAIYKFSKVRGKS